MRSYLCIVLIVWLYACNNSNSRSGISGNTDTLASSINIDSVSKNIVTDAEQLSAKRLKTITLHINDDNNIDTIILSTFTSGKRQLFSTISISLTGYARQIFEAKEAYAPVDSEFLKSNKNAIASNEVFIKKNKGQATLLLFGEMDGAGYRTEFSIINITDTKIEKVFDQLETNENVAIPKSLVDLDNDGNLDFIFTSYREQTAPTKNLENQGVFEAYCPFMVYTIDKECIMNKELTKKYNLENYVFAGFKYSEDIEVFIPADGGKKRAFKRGKDNQAVWISR